MPLDVDRHEETDVSRSILRLENLAGSGLAVHPERCVHVRNRHASCRRCADACTSGALKIDGGRFDVAPEKCVGCGTCATVCPTGALETCHPNDAELIARALGASRRAGHTVVFACHHAAFDRGVRFNENCVDDLVCLSRIEESLVATLFADGVDRVLLVRGNCDTCPRRQGLESVRLVKQTVDTLIEAWNLDKTFELFCDVPAHVIAGTCEKLAVEDALSIGRAFSAAGDSAAGEAEPEPVHVSDDGTLPHFVPVRRGRLLDALGTFGDPVVPTLATRLWGHVRIDRDLCRSCKMCAVFCPTGALTKYADEDGSTGIEHYLAECVHCCLCEDICPAHAIVSESEVPALELSHGDTERHEMPDPAWWTGTDQILRRMRPKIDSDSVDHSY